MWKKVERESKAISIGLIVDDAGKSHDHLISDVHGNYSYHFIIINMST